MNKKPYSAPMITHYGSIVKETNGYGGRYWEMFGTRVITDEEPPVIITM